MLLHVQHAVANGIFVSRMNRDFRWPQIHNISNDMEIRAVGLHAFTGCDTVVSAFCGKGKKSAWQTWEVFPDATDVFTRLSKITHSLLETDIEILRHLFVLCMTEERIH